LKSFLKGAGNIWEIWEKENQLIPPDWNTIPTGQPCSGLINPQSQAAHIPVKNTA
jgi:hypothetical protein